MIYDNDNIKRRWHKYLEDLYCHDQIDEDPDDRLIAPKPVPEPQVLHSEIRHAIAKMKSNKAPGPDNIPAELLKAGGETVVSTMKRIIDDIWITGSRPDDWTLSELVALPKVTGTKLCKKHRTLSVISHSSKILLEIIRSRITPFVRGIVADEQFGFERVKGRQMLS
jgi:hypothetical protein